MSTIDGNEVVPYTTHNGVLVRRYTRDVMDHVELIPHMKGTVVLIFNIALGSEVKDRIFTGTKFMDELQERVPKAYLYTLGYFGGHDFVLDLNQ